MTNHIEALSQRMPPVAPLAQDIENAVAMIVETYKADRKIMTCGNGGSAADAEHIVGELMKGFLLGRELAPEQKQRLLAGGCPREIADRLQKAIPAISLVSGVALPTAFANDVDGLLIFAQQVFGLGKAGDALIAISTSGNSKNVVYAAQTARALGIRIIALTGSRSCVLDDIADVSIKAPSASTPTIQEFHIAIYHALCAESESRLFG